MRRKRCRFNREGSAVPSLGVVVNLKVNAPRDGRADERRGQTRVESADALPREDRPERVEGSPVRRLPPVDVILDCEEGDAEGSGGR